MNSDYAYFFSVGGRVVWSSENPDSLRRRIDKSNSDLLEDFLESNPSPGVFIVLSDGDIVLRVRED